MAVIEAERISKIYQDHGLPVTALQDVNLAVEQSDFAAIVGPSGSGKTTLLNLLGGLDQPTAGRILVEGRDITLLKKNELIGFRLRHIGFVFQAFNLIPVLTARENVEFIMLLQKRPRRERKERTEELLRAVGLGELMERKPTELSAGQQQRVAVARAIASVPSFVLADEPTANLDTATAENLLDIMAELNRDRGTTFVFSTHDPRVMQRARRIVTLQDGRIVSDQPRV
jgi:putative ABC transport system ATP-binding protein